MAKRKRKIKSRAKSRAKLLKWLKYQRGKSVRSKDIKLHAKKGGKRRSKSGKIYWETRKNRTDLRGKV